MKNLILIFVFCFSAPTNSILIETIKKLGPYSNIFDSAEAGKAFFFPVCKKNKKNINGFVCFFDFFNVNYNSFSFFLQKKPPINVKKPFIEKQKNLIVLTKNLGNEFLYQVFNQFFLVKELRFFDIRLVEKNKSKRCILKVGNKIDEETVETKKIVSHLFSGEKKSDFKKKLFLEKIISSPVNVSLNIVLDTLGEPQHSDNQEKVLIYLDRHFCQSLTQKKEDPIVFFCFIFYDAIPEDQTNSKFQIITQKVVSNNSFCPYCFAKPL